MTKNRQDESDKITAIKQLDWGKFEKKIPLADYTWKDEADKIFKWASRQDANVRAFVFDLMMSLAYVDATSGLERFIEHCPSATKPYDARLGFINLCSQCYESKHQWIYQKAAKPESGALGKLSSELILSYLKYLNPDFENIYVLGGTDDIDALIECRNGDKIIGEVKSAPLITFPMLFKLGKDVAHHVKATMTRSQFNEVDSALWLHNGQLIPLGKTGAKAWPFKQMADFICSSENSIFMMKAGITWKDARNGYANRDKDNPLYWLANASGKPPSKDAVRDNWPPKESISDGKTSAGMDRTDDIKKGIYQTIKLGTIVKDQPKIKTALISNLHAYRHGIDYVDPFKSVIWGLESDVDVDTNCISRGDMRRAFDCIITILDPVMR
jgi:hypothetical protein